MKNIFIEIEYDGTNYCGWQVQRNGMTVQQKIEEAIKDTTGEDIRINGAGRTDAGVHALGQTATFFTEAKIRPEIISKALNQRLPEDISIVSSREVPMDFHARFSATGKVYRYLIFNRQQRSPFHENKAYRYGKSLDLTAMKEALVHFTGTHDFQTFMASGSTVEDTVRRIDRLELDKTGDLITIEIEGNGFLYNMVRIIAGTILECGEGKKKPEDIPGIIDSCNRKWAGRTLPGHGLYLMKVKYE
ncbi:MAG TPA: tRNA pseudouridine(38-40) synthase TruA [Clostridia bacterium]|nr:tRNA pseudouridine(38-40) synthase TruA [Clostridia bacterium]HRX43329.1 tRNA pseudouridine(38-40) synthase TruA [Clostridia bacterium]